MGSSSLSYPHPCAHPSAHPVAGRGNSVAISRFGLVGAQPLFDLALDIHSRPSAASQRFSGERRSVRGAEARRFGPSDARERPLCAPIAELPDCDLVRLQVQELQIPQPGPPLTRDITTLSLT